jgi:hypothetical protein
MGDIAGIAARLSRLEAAEARRCAFDETLRRLDSGRSAVVAARAPLD